VGKVAVARDCEAKVWNWRAREIRSLAENVESMVTPCTTDPMKAFRVRGLYLVSA